MSSPEDALRDAFQKAFADVWAQAILMIIAILILLAFCAGLAIWIEWKSYGR